MSDKQHNEKTREQDSSVDEPESQAHDEAYERRLIRKARL